MAGHQVDRVVAREWVVSVRSSTSDMYYGKYLVWAKTDEQARWKALRRANDEWPPGFSIETYGVRRLGK